MPESVLASLSQQPAYVPYATKDGPLNDRWRPESKRIMHHPPCGREHSGDLSSRGGQVRKGIPAQPQHALRRQEWERQDWRGIPDSQQSSDGYYNSEAARLGRGGIARRGYGGEAIRGGGIRGGYATKSSATRLGLQGVIACGKSFGSSRNNVHGYANKARVKPIRRNIRAKMARLVIHLRLRIGSIRNWRRFIQRARVGVLLIHTRRISTTLS
jgi:hypothetical protein